MRNFLIIIFLLLLLAHHTNAQEQWDEINNIKLAGLYYSGEAFGVESADVYNSAMLSLVNKINVKQIERGESLFTVEMIKGKEKTIKIPSEEGVRIFLYVSKKEINLLARPATQTIASSTSSANSTTVNAQPEKETESQGHNTSSAQVQANLVFTPNIIPGNRQSLITRLKSAEVYSNVEWILKQAKYDDDSLVYGKASSVGKTDDCYMIIINKNMYVEAILSTKVNGVRTNLKTKQQQEKGDFPNCAAIYFR